MLLLRPGKRLGRRPAASLVLHLRDSDASRRDEDEVQEGSASLCQDPSLTCQRPYTTYHTWALAHARPPACHELHVCCTHNCGTPTTTTITDSRSVSVVSISMLLRCRQDMRPWFHSCTKARPQGHAQHHNDGTGFACPKALFGGSQPLAVSPAGYGCIYCTAYSTQRMDIDMRSPQFTAHRRHQSFLQQSPHAHCKLPGLSQSYSLSPPAAVPVVHGQALDVWDPPAFLNGWAPAAR